MTTENLLQPYHNHFNLIRLFAALQVAFFHSDALLPVEVSNPVFLFTKKMLWFLPGVNIFFFISGFLVWRSLENTPTGIKTFFAKRIRRIYPGLTAAFLFVFLLMQLDAQFDDVGYFSKQMLKWVGAQFTLMQYMGLPNFHDYGTGVPNGPLWSVATELQFYLILPLIYAVLKHASLLRKNIVVFTLCAISFAFNHYQEQLMERGFPFSCFISPC
jgi:peptidoglycan/LPS O-acetylase OafA/YrhL